jgi:hypothetical protein
MTAKEKRMSAGEQTGGRTKIYLAAQFESRKRVRSHAHKMWAMGFEVVSSWLNEVAKPEHTSHEEFMRKLAMKDVAEVQSADILIQDTFKMSMRGGAATEFGLALHGFQNKLIFVVGPQRSVFHYLADRHFKTWDACLSHLKSL